MGRLTEFFHMVSENDPILVREGDTNLEISDEKVYIGNRFSNYKIPCYHLDITQEVSKMVYKFSRIGVKKRKRRPRLMPWEKPWPVVKEKVDSGEFKMFWEK